MNFSKEISNVKKGHIAPVYLVLGTEQYLADQFKQACIEGVLSEEDMALNYASYDMESVPLAAALEDANSVPFFGDKRLVVLDHPFFLTGEKNKYKVEHELPLLEQYLASPPDYSVLVIMAPYEKLDERKKIVKQLKKTAQIVEVKALSEKDLRKYLQDSIQNEGYQMTPEAFELFIELTDAKLTAAMWELPKLLLYASDSQKITKPMVADLIAKSLEQNIFVLVEEVLKKNVAQALEIYHDLLLQKEDPIKINAILVGQFRLLLQVKFLMKKGYQQGEIASMLKVHPYRIKLAGQQVRRFEVSALRDAFDGLIQTEYRLKTGDGDKEMLFELFLLQFSEQ